MNCDPIEQLLLDRVLSTKEQALKAWKILQNYRGYKEGGFDERDTLPDD